MRLYPNCKKFQYEDESTGKMYTFVFDGVEFYRLICWDGITETMYYEFDESDITWSCMKEAIFVLCKTKHGENSFEKPLLTRLIECRHKLLFCQKDWYNYCTNKNKF